MNPSDPTVSALHELSEMETVPELRPWLFQIAHNRATDQLQRYERRMSEPLDSVLETAPHRMVWSGCRL